MTTPYEAIREQASALTDEEKAALAHELIEQLDESGIEDNMRLWIEEAERRYEAYLKGEIEAVDSDEAIKRIRESLK